MKILNLNQFNEKFGIRKVSIDDVKLSGSKTGFPKNGMTPKESLEKGMVVEFVFQKQGSTYSTYGILDEHRRDGLFIQLHQISNAMLYQFDDNLLGTENTKYGIERFPMKCYIRKVYSCDDDRIANIINNRMLDSYDKYDNLINLNLPLIWESPFTIEDSKINQQY